MSQYNLLYNQVIAPRNLYKRNENICPNQDMNVTDYNSIILSQKVENNPDMQQANGWAKCTIFIKQNSAKLDGGTDFT